MTRYTERLIALRKRYPLLHSPSYLYGEEVAPGLPDIDWWDERGMRLAQSDWDNREGRALIMRLARRNGSRVHVVCVALNSSHEALVFNLPPPHGTRRLLIDSAHPDLPEHDIKDSYHLLPRAAALIAWVAIV